MPPVADSFHLNPTLRAYIQVISDNVCPWCYVGKRNLESAMKQFATSQPTEKEQEPPVFDVRWKPFFLNVKSPETSEEPIQVRRGVYRGVVAENLWQFH